MASEPTRSSSSIPFTSITPAVNPNSPVPTESPSPVMARSPDPKMAEVIRQCSLQPRPGQDGTWITPEMIKAYIRLHEEGYAHSVEAWKGDKLAGGLYGVSLGGAFFGESMFHLERDASKVAFYQLVEFIRRKDFNFIDAQQSTPHLKSLGAREIPREEFIKLISKSLQKQTLQGNWGYLG